MTDPQTLNSVPLPVPITAWALTTPGSHVLHSIYLREEIARMRALEIGLRVTELAEQTATAGAPIVWAVRDAAGAVSLHLQPAVADLYAARLHGTVHPMTELQRDEETAPRVARPKRDPQGELTAGGLMRL